MIDFRAVRERVPAEDAAHLYGLEFDRRGWAVCPFHKDKHPSISFKGGRFRCWACGANGDSLDFTARLFDLDSVKAALKLDADFHLGPSREARADPEAQQREQERRATAAAHKQFENWRERMMNTLNRIYYIAHIALQAGPPWERQQELAILYRARTEYLSDLLEAGSPEDQAHIYRERRAAYPWIKEILQGS